ncbi:DUF1543 domain-containing protein [Sphingobacterium lactis]|uniref:DUF1543 domain-containing protein n=1 Tax=Sphingobacterium lactis TaxID=797291 RepID=UPI003DA5D589
MNYLFMLVIGGKPDGRFTEQHDVFFGIAAELKELVPALHTFWPALEGKMHIDSWRRVTKVDGFRIQVVERGAEENPPEERLYFVNLGGYKPEDMEEYHYKQLVVASNLAEATKQAKESVWWKHHTSSHIDDKYGIDVDDIYEITDMLPQAFKEKYSLQLHPDAELPEDRLEVGYLKISKLLAQ